MRIVTERVITRRQSWVRVDWAALWRYRDLLWLSVRRDFVTRYQQTILGPLWFVIQPVVTSLVFTFVFARTREQTAGAPPAFLFYLAGMLPWSFFSTILGASGNTFHANASVFTKVYFPRLITPLAVVISSLMPLLIQSLVFLASYLPAKMSGGSGAWAPDLASLWLLPWCVLQTGLFAFGVALGTSALSAKYRDVQHALPFVVQMWMFVTPVIFPLAQLGPTARVLASLNPLTPIVETVRRALLGAGETSPALWIMSIGVTAVALAGGIALFQKAERTFADTV